MDLWYRMFIFVHEKARFAAGRRVPGTFARFEQTDTHSGTAAKGHENLLSVFSMKYLYTLLGMLLLGACTSSSEKEPSDPGVSGSQKSVARIEIQELFFDDPTYGDQARTTWDFSYDASGRVSQIAVTYVETGGDSSQESGNGVVTFRYGNGTISCEFPILGAETSRSGSATATLDAEGRIVSGVINGYDTKDEVATVCKYDLSYDSEGYLTQSDDSSEDPCQYDVTWENGNPVKLQWGASDPAGKHVDQARYNSVPNNTNLDLCWLLLQTEGWSGVLGDTYLYEGITNFLSLLKYAGQSSEQLPVEVSTDLGTWDNLYQYTYQLDRDGYVTGITSKQRSKVDNKLYERVKYVITYVE